MSRIYGGIHWQFDNQAGLRAGKQVGQFVSERLLRPRGPRRVEDAPGRCECRGGMTGGHTSFFADADDRRDSDGTLGDASPSSVIQ